MKNPLQYLVFTLTILLSIACTKSETIEVKSLDALFIEVGSNIKYPSTALEDSIQGKVFISFKVDDDGYTNDVEVMRGIRSDVDEEAKRVVQLLHFENLPDNMKTGMTIPISFNLN
ncbi:TonB family protein [Halosquirtibacter xylanolyticus]|uniref:energy transducer TonB n=1 Tax=Halosquirtibacter xylanolyticus TaxID=3374599 RepID=UPI003749CE38|nr:TonB family protein [Prolixibacteraceae bacterium]